MIIFAQQSDAQLLSCNDDRKNPGQAQTKLKAAFPRFLPEKTFVGLDIWRHRRFPDLSARGVDDETFAPAPIG
jgi:hypothetical protein